MAYDLHSNFGYSTVLTAPSPATSGTSLVVQSGHGTRFPTAPFNVVVWPANQLPLSSNAEIVRVTAKSTDTFTITRTQESTSARSIQVGDQIALNITAKWFTDIETNKVEGAASSTDNAITRFDSTTGKIVQNSLVTIDDTGNIVSNPTSGTTVFNETGADVDFRTEGDTDANLLFIDASTDRVGIGTATPTTKLDVAGTGKFSGDVLVPDEVYGSGWNGSLEVPTKNALYDKIETLGSGGGTV